MLEHLDAVYENEPNVEGKLCPKYHAIKREIIEDLREEYPYYCLTCDENYFGIELVELVS